MRALYAHSQESVPFAAGSAVTLSPQDKDKVINLDTAAGSTVTLPTSVGDNGVYKFRVSVLATTNNHIVKVSNTNDVLAGVIVTCGTTGAANAFATNATTDTITLNRGTTGSVTLGEWFEVQDVAAGTFLVRGVLSSTGSSATPFSATV
jgi:hypothetical protein